MAEREAVRLEGLPSPIAAMLSAFVQAARRSFGADLVSVVLFGSGAENKLEAASDVNLLLILQSFAPAKVARIRDSFLTAEAAIKLRVMFLMEDELDSAAELFALKFVDIMRRHRTIYGIDLLDSLQVSRRAEIFQLRQNLLNLSLRLREAFVSRGHQPEQVTRILAETFGPLQAASANLLELEGSRVADSTAALETVARSFGPQAQESVLQLAQAHRDSAVDQTSDHALVGVIGLVTGLFQRARVLAGS
jgi:hypothetical protein